MREFEEAIRRAQDAAGAYGEAGQREYRTAWVQGPNGLMPVVEYRDNPQSSWQRDLTQNWEEVWGDVQNARNALGDGPQQIGGWEDYPDSVREMMAQTRDILAKQNAEIGQWMSDDELFAAAEDRAAKQLGFESAQDMRDYYGGVRKRGVTDHEGLNEQELLNMRRDVHNTVETMRDDMDRAIDAIAGETGSTSRAIMAADEARRRIANVQVQGALGIMSQDFARKQYAFEAERDQMQLMVQQGAMSQQQYLQTVQTNRAITLQSWAQRMDTTLAAYKGEQASMLQAFGQDQQAINDYISNTRAVVEMDLGVRNAIDLGMDKAWERHVGPYLAQLESMIMQVALGGQGLEALFTKESLDQAKDAQADAVRAQKRADFINLFMAILGTVGKVATGGVA